jgi:hypothetical protein
MTDNSVFYTIARPEGGGWHFYQSPGTDGTVDACETEEEARQMVRVLAADDPEVRSARLRIVRVEIVGSANG